MERESGTISELRPGQRHFQNHFWVVGTPMTVYERCLLARTDSFFRLLFMDHSQTFLLVILVKIPVKMLTAAVLQER